MSFIKCIILGDGVVGKTSLIHKFIDPTHRVKINEYDATIFDNYSVELNYQQKKYDIHIWDTAGQEEYNQYRNLSYKDTNIILLCYSVSILQSYNNILFKWTPEINNSNHLNGVPIILIGTKIDQRNKDNNCVSYSQGLDLAEKIGAYKFFECSSVEDYFVKNIFYEVVDCYLSSYNKDHSESFLTKKNKKKRCMML